MKWFSSYNRYILSVLTNAKTSLSVSLIFLYISPKYLILARPLFGVLQIYPWQTFNLPLAQIKNLNLQINDLLCFTLVFVI